jgi:hypothetical protein
MICIAALDAELAPTGSACVAAVGAEIAALRADLSERGDQG